MYLMITNAGTPVWRLKYRYYGKERVFAIGVYPTIPLEAARTERDRVKAILRAGRDPVQTRLGHIVLANPPKKLIATQFSDSLRESVPLINADDASVAQALTALAGHLRSHIDEEREWMTSTAFPSAVCHLEEHDAVLRSVEEVQALVATGELSVARALAFEHRMKSTR